MKDKLGTTAVQRSNSLSEVFLFQQILIILTTFITITVVSIPA